MKTFEDLGVTGVKLNGSEQQKVLCPKCSHTRKNKSDKCLSVDVKDGMGNCHNCGWKFTLFEKEYVKIYTKPLEPPKIEVGVKTMEWFRGRGISEKTVSKFKINDTKQWMPEKGEHKSGERTCICFNYYRNSELVNVKYRDSLKNFRLVKDAELIFYNLDSIKGWSECIICEGEIDAMSFSEAGIHNVISVPNGASKNSKLEYLDNCIDYFQDIKKIIVATDGDEAGRLLGVELIRRLGSERCFTVTYPEGCKDANEILLKHGAKGVKTFIEQAKEVPLKGIMLIDKSNEVINDIYKHGYPVSNGIGFSEMDEHLKFQLGHFTVVTGVPNSGKSQWLDQVAVRLAIRNGWKFAVFSPENQPIEHHIIKLIEIFVGKPFRWYSGKPAMNEVAKDVSMEILSEYFYFMKIDDIDITIEGILNKARETILRFGVNALIIDPYNCIEHNLPRGVSETNYTSRLLQAINIFKLKYNVHVFLVAHPTKMGKRNDGSFEVPTLYDIAGSAHFYNKVDNGVTVYRNTDDTVDIHVQKVRFKWVGKRGVIKMLYDAATGRYCGEGMEFKSELQWLRDHMQQQQTLELEENKDTPF